MLRAINPTFEASDRDSASLAVLKRATTVSPRCCCCRGLEWDAAAVFARREGDDDARATAVVETWRR